MSQTSTQFTNGFFRQLGTIGKYARFVAKNMNAFRAMKKLYSARANLSRANMVIAKLGWHDPLYAQRVDEFNEVMIVLTQAKWKTACAMEAAYKPNSQSKSKGYWQEARTALQQSIDMSRKLLDALQVGSRAPLGFPKTMLSSQDTEILFAGDTPLVPEINPIVILRGTDYEMGYQYAQQLIQIFGPWLLQRKAGQIFSKSDLDCMHKWEAEIAHYAPEILEMCKGWSDGATASDVAMSYEDVLDLWTGHKPPAETLLGLADGEPFMAPPFCSGAAAWGRATVDGRLVTVSTGDHDAHHMVTIVAYPKTGNAFIISPFSATGDLAKLGGIYMFGHPGMNSQGLAYVEHGGMPKMIEPRHYWGYGLRMGTAVFHILRFANNAKEALEMELSLPVGDVGSGGFGAVGGFWVDREYGYVLDSRKEPVIVREAGAMGETDFLCAANSPLHPDAIQAGWMQADSRHWHWDPNGGWSADYRPVKKIGIDEDVIVQSLGNGFIGSRDRTIYLHNMIEQAVGSLDYEYMKMINRQGFPLPKATWKETLAYFNETGSWGEVSTGHASNADVVVMRPDVDGQGLYAMCVGAAARGLAPVMPTWCSPIYNETNTFWELQLTSTPEETVACAHQKARKNIERAASAYANLSERDPAHIPLEKLLEQARFEFEQGETFLSALRDSNRGIDEINRFGSAVRAFTRSQVRAAQVIEALCPPPSSPEHFRAQEQDEPDQDRANAVLITSK